MPEQLVQATAPRPAGARPRTPDVRPALLTDQQLWLFAERRFESVFDLSQETEQARYLQWWVYHMRSEYQTGPESIDWQHLASPAPGLEGPFSAAISVAMKMMWLMRPELQSGFDLATSEGRGRYICWYYRWGLFQAGLDDTPYVAAALAELSKPCSFEESTLSINRFAAAVLTDLPCSVVSAVVEAGLVELEHFFVQALQQLAGELLFIYRLMPHGILAAPSPTSCTSPSGPLRKYGANLLGYAHGAFGMGEHVRMTARALSHRTDAFTVVDVGAYPHTKQPEPDVVDWVSRKQRYRTDIFHVNADAMAAAVTSLGPGRFDGTYKIGYWAWELSKVPADWQTSIDFVDEIWAPSRFIQEAYQSFTRKPVVYMPLCVDLSFNSWRRRKHFGLPDRTYLFLYYFDGFSYYQRKNPYAALRAFKAAFPERQDVGLVIKAQNAKEDSPGWRELMELVAGDPRVFVINKTLTKSEVMSLQAECDCFVSLHRSEGFGRGPAEAMWLGKPVIATGYSGNVDFTRPDNSLLVDYRLVDVKRDEYPFWEGQVWAEPDEAHAAAHMRRLTAEPQLGAELGRKASMLMRSEFSYCAIGARYEARLKEIGALR